MGSASALLALMAFMGAAAALYGLPEPPEPPRRKDGGRWYVHALGNANVPGGWVSQSICGSGEGRGFIALYSAGGVGFRISRAPMPPPDRAGTMHHLRTEVVRLGRPLTAVEARALWHQGDTATAEIFALLVERGYVRSGPEGSEPAVVFMASGKRRAVLTLLRGVIERYRQPLTQASAAMLSIIRRSAPPRLEQQVRYTMPGQCGRIGVYALAAAHSAGPLPEAPDPLTAGILVSEW